MPGRNAFFSFHYALDNWRASQVRNMGAVEGNSLISDNDWEQVKRGGDVTIKRWIDSQLSGCSCVIVLIGSQTSRRTWVLHEIATGWNAKKGVVGIYVHNLKDSAQAYSSRGDNPFERVTVGGRKLSSVVKAYGPPYRDGQQVYTYIKHNLPSWVEEAISIRGCM